MTELKVFFSTRVEPGELRVMSNFLNKLWKDESGISSVEYALLLAFIGGGIIVAAALLGEAVENELTATADCLNASDPITFGC